VNISQNWMLMLKAVVSVHRTVMKGNDMHSLLQLFFCVFCIILPYIIEISLEQKSYGANMKGVTFLKHVH